MRHANLNGYNNIFLQYRAWKTKYQASKYAGDEVFVPHEEEFFSNIERTNQ